MQYIACYHLYKIQINTYIDTEYLPRYFFELKKKLIRVVASEKRIGGQTGVGERFFYCWNILIYLVFNNILK